MTAETTPSLLFAEVFLVWQAALYLFSADPIRPAQRPEFLSHATQRKLWWFCFRGGVAAALTIVAAGWPAGLILGVAVFVGCILVPVARWFWTPPRYVAEYEIAVNLVFVLLAQLLITRQGLQAQGGPSYGPRTDAAAYMIAAALLVFVVRGGTLIVRGVLDRAGTMPPAELTQAPSVPIKSALDLKRALPVDTIELNHGRLIGNIERLILVLLVANDQYTALAFFFAAKGLIRSKDVERRAWADYLILGSLTSFLIAVVVGLLIRAVFRMGGR